MIFREIQIRFPLQTDRRQDYFLRCKLLCHYCQPHDTVDRHILVGLLIFQEALQIIFSYMISESSRASQNQWNIIFSKKKSLKKGSFGPAHSDLNRGGRGANCGLCSFIETVFHIADPRLFDSLAKPYGYRFSKCCPIDILQK